MMEECVGHRSFRLPIKRGKTAPAANKQKVTASADRKSVPMKSARIERADGTERSYLFFRGAEADGCLVREAAVKHRTDYFEKRKETV